MRASRIRLKRKTDEKKKHFSIFANGQKASCKICKRLNRKQAVHHAAESGIILKIRPCAYVKYPQEALFQKNRKKALQAQNLLLFFSLQYLLIQIIIIRPVCVSVGSADIFNFLFQKSCGVQVFVMILSADTAKIFFTDTHCTVVAANAHHSHLP